MPVRIFGHSVFVDVGLRIAVTVSEGLEGVVASSGCHADVEIQIEGGGCCLGRIGHMITGGWALRS